MSTSPVSVLLIDDDEDVLFLTQDLLEEVEPKGYRVDWASTYSEAIEEIRRGAHDVYLLDFRLGAQSGIDLLQAAGDVWRDHPAVLMTGQGDRDVDLQAMRSGAAAYLGKDQLNAPLLERTLRYAIERKHAERLERERAALQEAGRAMERVVGIVAHELRTPLAGLRAMAEYLLTDGAEQLGEGHQFLHAIHNEIIRLAEMTTDLLEAARMDSGRSHWNWSEVSLPDACRDAIDIVRVLVPENGPVLSTHVEPVDLTMAGDADAVRRLLINLLSNAIKHTPSGRIHVEITPAMIGEDEGIQLAVSDTGNGMSDAVLAQLGDAFALNRGLIGVSATGGGGLGLSICKGIAAVHGGEMEVRSSEGQGTTFIARLRADLLEPVAIDEELRLLRGAA